MDKHNPGIARLRPYVNMHSSGVPAARSILLSIPAVPVLGLFAGIKEGDVLFSAVSFCATLSQILPVALVNVPFDRTTLYAAFVICIWWSISIVSLMILTLFFVFFYRPPTLPIQPRTLAAALYYLDASGIPERTGHLATVAEAERNRQIKSMGLRYSIGRVTGHDGRTKVGLQAEY